MKATEYHGMTSNSTSVKSPSLSCHRYGAGTGRSWPGHRKNLIILYKVCVTYVYMPQTSPFNKFQHYAAQTPPPPSNTSHTSTFTDHELTRSQSLHTTSQSTSQGEQGVMCSQLTLCLALLFEDDWRQVRTTGAIN